MNNLVFGSIMLKNSEEFRMKIQYIGYNYLDGMRTKDFCIEEGDFLRFKILEDYDVNFISFNENEIWKNFEKNTNSIVYESDLKYIFGMIEKNKKSKIIIILPQNFIYQYNYNEFRKRYINGLYLKEILPLLNRIFFKTKEQWIVFGSTSSEMGDAEINSDFYFNEEILKKGATEITRSIRSEKLTTIKIGDNLYYTTLNLDNGNAIKNFNNFISNYIISNSKDIPDWIKEYNFNDDIKLKEEKEKIENELRNKELEKKENVDQINRNNRYKSILFLTGESLVTIIKEMLEEMLEIDLSGFEDKKREDIRIIFEDVTFIVEIKGINSSVKNSNISQLDNHVELYNEEEKGIKGKGILIINPERTRSIEERNPIHDSQIKKIEKDENLMITTEIFLKLFELFKQNKIKKEKIKSILQTEVGILTIEKLNDL